MKETLKKIWNDPVGSKVISVGIVGLFSYLGFLIGKYFLSDCQKLALFESFEKILKIKISIIYVIIILVVCWILVWLFKKFFKKEKSHYNKKQLKLREINEWNDETTGILFRWGVYFDYGTPFIANLTAYCTKHGEPPYRFMQDRCVMQDCVNSKKIINMEIVKNVIESRLIHEWDKLK